MKPHERDGSTEHAAGDEVQYSSGARLTFLVRPPPFPTLAQQYCLYFLRVTTCLVETSSEINKQK